MKKENVLILEHESVPAHKIITNEELNALLKKYKILKEQLPKVKSTDPVIKEINAEPGDVVEIRRSSRTAGTALSYRLVIK